MKTRTSSLLRLTAALLLVLGFSLSANVTAHAGSCDSKASALAASVGGKVLSARAQGNNCKIRILIKAPNKPPRQKSYVVPK